MKRMLLALAVLTSLPALSSDFSYEKLVKNESGIAFKQLVAKVENCHFDVLSFDKMKGNPDGEQITFSGDVSFSLGDKILSTEKLVMSKKQPNQSCTIKSPFATLHSEK